jgi:anti-sigma B factor antagonist
MSSEEFMVERFGEGSGSQGVLRLKGPLTFENLSSFQNAIRREDSTTVILDLTEVPYVDSAGLGSLVSTYVTGQKAGRRMILTGVNDRVLKLFEITRVEPLFLIFPTVWDAIEALTGAGRA